jgi:predicted phage terminase large subunit-like protein
MQHEIRDIDIKKTWVLSSTLNFTRYFFKKQYKRKFVVGEHHRLIAEKLDQVLAGKITKLIINIAPRYSKTEMAVKNFIANGLALNPKARFIHLSYSDDLALDNSKAVQEILSEPAYQQLFTTRAISRNAKRWSTNEGGGLYAVSSSGQVTGFGAGLVDDEDEAELSDEVGELDKAIDASESFGGAIVIDDPIKPDDALSPTVREKVNRKFETTIRNRVNSRKTPIIIIMQRLNEEDLTGYLRNLEPEDWEVLSIPCIQIDEETGDERALWPFKHSLEELYKIRENNAWVFDTQYMQNPMPMEGLMYENGFKEYEALPHTRVKIVKNYTDTADTGADYLCSITYLETEIGNYVLDILYTKKPMEYTEPKTAEMLTRYKVELAIVESNNGGRSFARAVEQQCRIMNNNSTRIKWFHQILNKQARIFSNSAAVHNLTYFPKGWRNLYPQFANDLLTYKKVGTNAHDDAPDALTGTIEHRPSERKRRAADYFP